MCAKPILDVLVSIRNFAAGADLVPKLGTLDYEFRPEEEIPDRHYFRRPPGGGVRTHHLSLAEPGSRYHRVTLAFRAMRFAETRISPKPTLGTGLLVPRCGSAVSMCH